MTTYTCTQCGQTIDPRLVVATDRGGVYTVPLRCDPCEDALREPQGTAVRLFEPTPTQLEGQLTL